MLTGTAWSMSVNARQPAALRPARPRPRNRLGERPSNLVGVAAGTTAGVGVAAAAAAIASSLRRSTNPAVRAAGYGIAGAGALVGATAVGLGGGAVANDIAYQNRMEAVGQQYNFTPQTRGQRVQRDLAETRKAIRGERANYDRPLDGKPITEAGLPDYQSAQSFAKATQAAFPEGTQFTVKIRRHSVTSDIKKPDEVTELSTVETRFVKGGMTGRNVRGFMRGKETGELIVLHNVFTINGEGQGSGIAKQVLKAQFDEYEKLGVAEVAVHANIDVGGYAWARFGFVPDQDGWNSLRKSLKQRVMVADYEPIAAPKTDEEHQFNAQLSRVLATLVEMGEGPVKLSSREKRAVNKLLKNPDPKTLWKLADARLGDRNIGKELLLGSHWNGHIRLDDADAMARFNHYTGRGK